MEDPAILKERAQNLWASFGRKVESVAQATRIDPIPEFGLANIGGLEGPKEEIQTYACAVTSPEVYEHWGTYPPSGLLLIGRPGVGKSLLARALASLTHTSFLNVAIPRLVIEVIHRGGNVGELLNGWSQILSEMPPLTILFNELEFSQAREIGAHRADLPVGPVMDLLLDLVDRSIATEGCLVVGSTSHPDTLRHAFAMPNRLERVVEVAPIVPDDIVEALLIHASRAEKRAGGRRAQTSRARHGAHGRTGALRGRGRRGGRRAFPRHRCADRGRRRDHAGRPRELDRCHPQGSGRDRGAGRKSLTPVVRAFGDPQ